MAGSQPTGALDDLRVVDLTRTFWGAMAGTLLGDFGADVVRLDSPDGSSREFPDDIERPALGDNDCMGALVHRNRRSVAVDISNDEGRALARELAATADVFLTDLSSDELGRCGLDEKSLRAGREDLVYLRGSAFGPLGPDSDRPPLDELAAARTGMMPILPEPGQPPVYPGHGQMYTSVMLALGAVTALLHRRASGEGQAVDASLLGGNMYGASLDLQAFLAIGGQRFCEPVSRLDAGNPMSGTKYPTSDRLWVTLTMPETDRWWPALSGLVGLDSDDPRFATHDLRCGDNRVLLMELLDGAFRLKSAAHWRERFNELQMSADVIEGYEFPAADPQASDNRYIIELEGGQRSLGFPVWMQDTPAAMHREAPAVGEHTDELLLALDGMDEARLERLREAGVVSGPATPGAVVPGEEG